MAVTEQVVAMAPAASAECSSLVQHIPTHDHSSTVVFDAPVPRVGVRGRIISRLPWAGKKGVRGPFL